jgi:hypothetical protein
MEPNIDVLATLEAKARKTTIEELQQRGRRQLKVIRASEISGMIQESIRKTLEASDLLPREQVDELVDRASAEFDELKEARIKEQHKAREIESKLSQVEKDLEEARLELEKAQNECEALRQQGGAAGAPQAGMGDGGASAAVMMKMMEELMILKAQVQQGTQGAATPAANDGGGGASGLEAQLSKIAGALDEKLDRFGKKMGLSSAVDTANVDFSKLADRALEESAKLESNVDDVEIEKRKGAGIMGNLDKIRKMRGG